MSQPRSQSGTPAPLPLIPTDPKELKRFRAELRERCAYLDESGGRLVRKHGKTVEPEVAKLLETQWQTLHALQTAKSKDTQALLAAAEPFDQALDVHLGQWRKSASREYFDSILWAVALTLLIRIFVFEAFKIPTGSMIPTLQVVDHLFVNKFIYGAKLPFTRIKFLNFRAPHRGEIIVFEYPYRDGSGSEGKDLIKRVIGTPGDRLRMIDNVMHINGKPIPRKVVGENVGCGQKDMSVRCEVARECLDGVVYTTQRHIAQADVAFSAGRPDWPTAIVPGGTEENAAIYSLPANKDFPDFVVPEGFVLGMGDNRDNSQDSRFFGLIPFDTIKGRASVRWFAATDERCSGLSDWLADSGSAPGWLVDATAGWTCKPNFSRMFELVHETTPGGTCDNF